MDGCEHDPYDDKSGLEGGCWTPGCLASENEPGWSRETCSEVTYTHRAGGGDVC